jgi:hypothetical protein
MAYVTRHGRRIEVITINPDPSPIPKRRRKSFEPWFVKLPRHWISDLERATGINTYRLAHRILWEAFKNERGTGEVILSSRVTGMSRETKARAARELVELGLIRLKKGGGTRALRAVVTSYHYPKNEEK